MKKQTSLITAILLTLLFSCKDNSVDPDDSYRIEISGSSYTNKILGISLSAPEGWKLEKDVTIGQFHAILFGSKNGTIGSHPSFNIIEQTITTAMDAQMLLNSAEQTLPQMFPSLVLDSKRVVNVNGFECAEVVYHHNYNGVNLKQKQLMFMCKSTKLLVITFDSDLDGYDSYSNEFESIQNSIQKL